MSLESTITPHIRATALLGALACAVGAYRNGARVGFSVALGATLAIANLLAIRFTVETLTRSGTVSNWNGLAILRQTALFGGTFVVLGLRSVSAPAFVVGLALLPLGLVLGELPQLFNRFR
jgi:hypothetical protein